MFIFSLDRYLHTHGNDPRFVPSDWATRSDGKPVIVDGAHRRILGTNLVSAIGWEEELPNKEICITFSRKKYIEHEGLDTYNKHTHDVVDRFNGKNVGIDLRLDGTNIQLYWCDVEIVEVTP